MKTDEELAYLTVQELWNEILDTAVRHPVTRMYSLASDVGGLRRDDPIFEENARITDLVNKARLVVEQHENSILPTEEAEKDLVHIIGRLEEGPSDKLAAELQESAARFEAADIGDVGLMDYLVERFVRDIERHAQNTYRVAQHVGYGTPVFPPDLKDPLSTYLLDLDTIGAEAHSVKEQYEQQEISGVKAVSQLQSLRELALQPRDDIPWHRKGKLAKVKAPPKELVFKLFDQIAFAYESHPAVVAVRKGTASENKRLVASYLSEAYQAAKKIKELEREEAVNTSIALRALERLLAEMQQLVPTVQEAGKKLPRSRRSKLPRITDAGALDALAAREGDAWRAKQEADKLDPGGFYANLQAVQVLASMGDAARGLMVADLLEGGGVIEGGSARYEVEPDGRLSLLVSGK